MPLDEQSRSPESVFIDVLGIVGPRIMRQALLISVDFVASGSSEGLLLKSQPGEPDFAMAVRAEDVVVMSRGSRPARLAIEDVLRFLPTEA